MIRRPASRRPGITLLEVLTAIFIMGIGMLALLTLFPLGALSMARGIRDDRAATMAANAAALATMFELRKDADVESAMTQLRYKQPPDPAPLTDPDSQAYLPVNPNDPSNPVFVDPHYVLFNQNDPPRLGKVGTQANLKTPGLRRAAPGFLRGVGGGLVPQMVNYWFTLQDEIEFDTFGGPVNRTSASAGNYVNRPGTYTFAYLVRRPRHGSPELIELTVVIYASRVVDVYDPEVIAGVTSSIQERTYFTSSPLGMRVPPPPSSTPTNQILIPWPPAAVDVPFNPPEKPDIRKGTWLLDVSYAPVSRTVNGHFYRAENVSEVTGGFLVELDREVKANISAVTVMRNVIAVVERGTTWIP